jgi:hypothetical protein
MTLIYNCVADIERSVIPVTTLFSYEKVVDKVRKGWPEFLTVKSSTFERYLQDRLKQKHTTVFKETLARIAAERYPQLFIAANFFEKEVQRLSCFPNRFDILVERGSSSGKNDHYILLSASSTIL